MKEGFDALKLKAKEELEKVTSSIMLVELKAKYVGKNGEVTGLLRGMKDIPPAERAEFGKIVNVLKEEIIKMFDVKAEQLKNNEMQEKFKSEAIDVTLPGKINTAGSLHPLNIVKNKILDAFCGMGFEVFEQCSSLTIYCEISSPLSGWNSEWNREYYGKYVNVVWNYKGN